MDITVLSSAACLVAIGALGVVWLKVRAQRQQLVDLQARVTVNDHVSESLNALPSRSGLVSLVKERHAATSEFQIAVIAFEVVDLARIKDSMGFAAGERVMGEVSRRLQDHTRGSEQLARAGDDRFLLMLGPPVSSFGALRAAQRLADNCADPITVDGVEFQIRVRAGAAVGLAEQTDQVLDDAEFAMSRASLTGDAKPVLYDQGDRENAEEAFRRAQGLRTAVAHNELRIAYQPVLELSTGRFSGVEALLRWDSPTLGPVSPADFIPIAEDTGAIVEIGSWVLERACHHILLFDEVTGSAPGEPPSVSVNVSVHQLRHQGFLDIVHTALMSSGLQPSRLLLEVTESVFANPADVVETLEQLRAMGVRIALDDVGTGYSSLAQLTTLPIDVMKLDRTLLRHPLEPDDAAARVFKSMAALGRSLDLQVVAEGVETEAHSEFARAAGCTHEQGFLRSRPVSVDAAIAFALDISEGHPAR